MSPRSAELLPFQARPAAEKRFGLRSLTPFPVVGDSLSRFHSAPHWIYLGHPLKDVRGFLRALVWLQEMENERIVS